MEALTEMLPQLNVTHDDCEPFKNKRDVGI